MKRFIKYFSAILGVAFIAFIFLIHYSGFQKACLLGVLRCHYNEVSIENFHGGATAISWGKIFCKSKKNTLVVSNFSLKWYPWRLIFKRTLSVDNLNCDVCFTGDCDELNATQVQHAGWFLNGHKSETYSLLKNLQSPIKLDIASATVNLTLSFGDINLKEGVLQLEGLQPENMGTFRYNGKIVFAKDIKVSAHGEFALQSNKHGAWEKIRCYGEAKTTRKGVRYPRLSFNGIIDGTTSVSKEEIRAEVHCGQANDFLLTGECIKDSDRVYDFKWQGFLDHSLFKFFNISAYPVLSVLAEGNGVFNRKHHVWTTHTNLSAWGKHFEMVHPSLKSLPCLSFKAQIGADITAKQLDLKQYKFVLKEKGAPRLFLDVTSLHPLTYFYKDNKFGLPSKEDSQIFEINFYETPFEIFNPYLTQYGFQITGNLQSGNVNVGWNSEEKRWTLATFQPICAQIRQLSKDNTICLKDTIFRLSTKCALKHTLDEVKYDTNWVASDLKHVSFFKFAPKGYVNLKHQTLTGEGVFSLDNTWAKDLFFGEPLGLKLDPNLLAKLNYNFEYKPGKLLVNQLKFSLNSSADKNIGLELRTEQPLYFSKDDWRKTKEGDMVSFLAQNYPLDFVQYRPLALSGTCNGHLSIKKADDKIQCNSEVPLSISQFKWQANLEDRLSLNRVLLDFGGNCDEKLNWSFNLDQVNVVSDDEKQPLLSGNCAVAGTAEKLVSTKGQIVFNLDKLCAQPLMLTYPGFIGEFNSHWIWDEKQAEANGRLRCQPLGSNFIIEAKSSYKQAEKPLVKTSLELQSQAHSSDIYIDTTWDKNNSIDCQIHSENLFMKDIVRCYEELRLLSGKFIAQKTPQNEVKDFSDVTADKPLVPTASAPKTEKISHKEMPIQGLVHLNLKSVHADVPFLEQLNGTIVLKKDAVHMENLTGKLCSGNIELKSDYSVKNSRLEISGSGTGINMNPLWKVPGALGYPLDKYGQMSGNLDMKMKLSGELGKPFSWYGACDVACKAGYYKIFNASNKAGQAIGGIASTLGLLLSANVSGMSAVGFLTSYIQGIPYHKITCACSRDIADEIVCQGSAINDDLAICFDGSIGMKEGLACAQQPLSCALKFSAPENSPFLNYFSFDRTQKDEHGYYIGPNCKMGGTLGKPDYSALVNLVTSARNEKPEPKEKASPVEQLLKTLF